MVMAGSGFAVPAVGPASGGEYLGSQPAKDRYAEVYPKSGHKQRAEH